jgi:formyltetrahydrofolate synthetase
METIAKQVYGADGIEILPEAQKQLDTYKRQVLYGFIQVFIAKDL